jgi:hypothetical protein
MEFPFTLKVPGTITMVSNNYTVTVQRDYPLPPSMLNHDFPRSIAYYLTLSLFKGNSKPQSV